MADLVEQPLLTRAQRLEARHHGGRMSDISRRAGRAVVSAMVFLRQYPVYSDEQLAALAEAGTPHRDIGNFEYYDAAQVAYNQMQSPVL